eukprot:1834971-Amphidinium_carterae.1
MDGERERSLTMCYEASLEEALQLSRCYSCLGGHDAECSIRDSRQSEYLSGEALVLYTLSEVHLYFGRTDQALRFCSEAQVLYETIGDRGREFTADTAKSLRQSALWQACWRKRSCKLLLSAVRLVPSRRQTRT